MSVRGWVRTVALEPRQTEIVSVSGVSLVVEWPEIFDDGASTSDPAYLSVNGNVLRYVGVDDDTSTITLAFPAPGGTATGDMVAVIQGDQIAVDLVAYVDTGDGMQVEVIIPFRDRDLWPEGDYDPAVMVVLSDDMEQILDVPGRLPARSVTRSDGVLTSYVDKETGHNTFIGEFGSAPPGEPGVFGYSQTFSRAGEQVTRPTVQWNTGAGRDQPNIAGDTDGTGAGLTMFSGASPSGRESWVWANQGQVTLGIEDTPDSGTAGSQLILNRTDVDVLTEGGARLLANADTLLTQSEYHDIGGTTMASIVYGTDAGFTAGYRTSDGAHIEGLQVAPGGSVQIMSAGDLLVTTAGGASWQNATGNNITAVGDLTSQALLGGSTTSASIDASGKIIRTPSSRRYKTDVRPLDPSTASKVLDLEPVTFALIDEAGEAHPRLYPGGIAEQALAAGLDLWVDRNKDGEPDGLRYPELTVALISVAREQRDQIDALNRQLAELSQQVADLRGKLKTKAAKS